MQWQAVGKAIARYLKPRYVYATCELDSFFYLLCRGLELFVNEFLNLFMLSYYYRPLIIYVKKLVYCLDRGSKGNRPVLV